jgi:hypothetical protein
MILTDRNRRIVRRLHILQDQVQHCAGRHPRERVGVASQGQRDGPGPDPDVRQPGPGRGEVHAAPGY